MNRLRRALLVTIAAGGLLRTARAATASANATDFDALWNAVNDGYAYFERGGGDWRRAREAWRPRALRATNRAQLIAALEGALAALRDDHASLNEHTHESPRRVPAETDIWAAWKGSTAVVEAVRTYGDADAAGLRPGHVILSIDGQAPEAVVRKLLGAAAAQPAARDWALRHALAGPRSGALRIEATEAGRKHRAEIERRGAPPANGTPVLGRRIGEGRDLGYLRIRGGLLDPQLVQRFDAALEPLADTRALILDLRDTGDPGSREVTTALLGRFVRVATPWQVRAARAKPRIVDTVEPRSTPYLAPVAVLVDRWTAGESEALAAGLNAAAAARWVGTATAGLRGELREVRLPGSGLVARFPAERTFHIDGTPRERLRPAVTVDLAAPSGGPGDPILYQALKLLERR